MPLTRANKVNENDEGADVNQRKRNIVTRNKNGTVANVGRPALGEVSNNLVKNEAVATNRTEQTLKATLNLKNVKPKVDSYWKKSEIPTVNAKRRNSPDYSAPILVKTKSSRVADPMRPYLVNIKLEGGSKKSDLGPSKKPMKRQESILNRKHTLRNAIAETVNVCSSSSAAAPLPLQIKQDKSATSHSTNLLKDVEDIDENDAGKLNLESEYVNDIYNYLQDLEKKFAIPENYLADQKEISPKMRTVLIDWLNEVHLQFHLLNETYYLTVGIIDRYLKAVTTTSRKNLQLVGVAAMFIACKYEEMYPPMLKDFVFITDDTYSAEQIMSMEKFILKQLQYDLSAPSVIHFARRFSKASNTSQTDHTIVKYFIELASIEYSMIQYLPSKVAAAAVFITMKLKSRNQPNDKLWSPTMIYYTKYRLDDLSPVIRNLAEIVMNAPKAKEKAVYSKYSSNSFEKIALRSDIYGHVMGGLCTFHS